MTPPRLRLPENRKVRAGLAVLALFVAVALFGPYVVEGLLGLSPSDIHTTDAMQGPSGTHPLGTTATGEDVLAQVVAGARISLLVGLVAGTVTTVLSVLVGVTGGYLGGRTDSLLTAITNVSLVIPGMPLLIIIASYAQGRGGWLAVALIIGLTAWPWGARQKRAQTLSLRHRDFVTAAEMTGESRWGVITREIVPSLAPIISVSFLGAVVGSMFADAGLSFIGLGNINTTSWGSMLYWAQNGSALSRGAWWWFVPPGACIALVGLAAGLVNFGMDEISNPRMRRPGRRARRLAAAAAQGARGTARPATTNPHPRTNP
ncbi:ABC transporter permease [Streptomyces longispororuber]|uniref:ABC transporter permease n=1 Tax=Streptomyces longispororuber TaxID=68230 RepID=UPI00210C1C78|nr:ABC transporter permease [Streptomyces longispororuber]MCQ4211994.1 ABC transporter permease [Streptomyces longispororuber]